MGGNLGRAPRGHFDSQSTMVLIKRVDVIQNRISTQACRVRGIRYADQADVWIRRPRAHLAMSSPVRGNGFQHLLTTPAVSSTLTATAWLHNPT
jgi:hypothetical protein